jgi:hypothetical protein
MANAHELELFITDDGELKVHIKGIKGPGCLKVMDALAGQLGGKTQDIKLTPEYYESAKTEDKSNTNLKNK